jgi:hypothetical protein
MLARVLWDIAIVIGSADLFLLGERLIKRHYRKLSLTERVEIQMSKNEGQPAQHRAPATGE